MYCVKCGRKNSDGSIFCVGCGQKIGSEVINDSSVKGEVARDIITTGTRAGKKAISKGKKIGIISGIIASIAVIGLAFANYYFTYLVDTPIDVVQKFTEAANKRDVKAIVSCMDPTFQKQFEATASIAGGILGALEVPIDIGSALDISSAFSDYISADMEKCNFKNFKVVKYEGDKLKAFVDKFGNKIPAIGNALGSKAIVEFETEDKEFCYNEKAKDGNKLKYTFEVYNYGGKWLIPSDTFEDLQK